MKTRVCSCAHAARPMRLVALWVVAGWVAVGAERLVSAADSPPTIVRVEEDWELVVENPDPDSIAPQVTCTIAPTGGVDSLYATLEINHQTQPVFVPGGIQLQLWNGETPVSNHKYPHDGIMSQPGETVRWTQTMTLHDGYLTFRVINGESETWGSVGGYHRLSASVATDLPNLNGYDPNVSVENSGVGYASNRVQFLILKAVRAVTSTDEVLQDITPRPVYPR